jgi:hypothetical protein
MTRPLHEIAAEIRSDWKKPFFGALPYLNAMAELSSIQEMYFQDSACSIVNYFLVNATTWRGEVARRVKAELKALLKQAEIDHQVNYQYHRIGRD